jgi:hypothetical protein
LVWKYGEKETKEENGELKLDLESKDVSILADLSLFSFLKVIAKINKFSHILKYREDLDLKARL